jgi:hypothetical protein
MDLKNRRATTCKRQQQGHILILPLDQGAVYRELKGAEAWA